MALEVEEPDGATPLSQEDIEGLRVAVRTRVWKWAGAQRIRDTTIGVSPHLIAMRLRDVLQDARYWLEHKTFPLEEIAIRYHHRLVAVHPFQNGNGRHARLAADDLMLRNGGTPLRWGGGDLLTRGDVRARYIAALRDADRGDYRALIEACR